MELRAVQDEEHHRESDSDDLNDEEHHDSLRSQSAHVEHEGGLERRLRDEDADVDVVAVTAEEGVDEALDDDQVED